MLGRAQTVSRGVCRCCGRRLYRRLYQLHAASALLLLVLALASPLPGAAQPRSPPDPLPGRGAQQPVWGAALRAADLASRGDLEGARAALAVALSSEARPALRTAMALLHQMAGDLQAALAELELATGSRPTSAAPASTAGSYPDAHYHLAIAWLQASPRHPASALERLDRAIEVGGDLPAYQLARAILLREVGRPGEAAAAIARAAAGQPDLLAASLYPSLERGFLRAIEQVLHDFPDRRRATLTLAALYLAANLVAEAEGQIDRLDLSAQLRPDVARLKARCRLLRGDAAAALRVLDAALRGGSQDAGLRALRAEVYLGQGKGQLARPDVEAALAAAPGDPLLLVRAASLRLEAGDAASAEQLYDYALRRQPRLASAHFGLAQAHDRAHRDQQALAAYQAAVLRNPAEPRYHAGLALFLERHRRLAEARRQHAAATAAQAAASRLERRQAHALHTLRALERASASASPDAVPELLAARVPSDAVAFYRIHLALRQGETPPMALARRVVQGLSKHLLRPGWAPLMQQPGRAGEHFFTLRVVLDGANPEWFR